MFNKLNEKEKYIFDNFEKWIDNQEFFAYNLLNKNIDYWNFNCYAYQTPIRLFAIRKSDKEKDSLWKKCKVLKEYKDLLLLLNA